MLDLAIRGGTVVDGTGAPGRRADVGVHGGRIVALGEVKDTAATTINAEGLIVAPGFIDIHTHYDAQVFWDSALTPSPLHGVTTVIGGNCGFTLAPIEPSETEYITRMLSRVEGMPLQSLMASVRYDWRSFADYLKRIEGSLAINAGFLVGHCALRRTVMGDAAVGNQATPKQIEAMQRLLAESLAGGGLGFSSTQAPTHNDSDGNPVPSRSASRQELLALCEVLSRHPGTVLEFIPTVGAFSQQHLELMRDMSLAGNRPLNWNALAPSAENADSIWEALRASDFAAEGGARVIALVIPDPVRLYLNFESGMVLDALPGWADTFRLPLADRVKALANPIVRRHLEEGARSVATSTLGPLIRWERMTVIRTFVEKNDRLAGRTIGDIASERSQAPLDVLFDIVVADDLRTVLLQTVGADDDESWSLRRDVWLDPRTIVGASDAGAHLDMLNSFCFSTQVLRAAREHNLMPVETAVRLLTDDPARLYGLTLRGRIANGWHADLVVFDCERVGPNAAVWRDDLPGGAGRVYADAQGIEHVFVAGQEIVRRNKLTGRQPGAILRSGRDTSTVTLGAK